MGISCDPVPSKIAWAEKLGGIASLDLLSDFWPHGDVCQQYGVLLPIGFPSRAIFIVDKAGKIAWVRHFDRDEQPETLELLEALEHLVKS